ncbi:MAG: DUF2520 domain-containing protein [Solirubrobacterales bacterium]
MSPHRADTPALPPITLVGPGRVGTALAGAATIAGLDVTLAGRDDLDAACAEAEVVLLCVPDAEITTAAGLVAASAPQLRMIGHTSGATELGALASATSAGATAFSLHPLQTIPAGDAQIVGAPAAVEGTNAAALDYARELATVLGMRPFELPAGSRAAYHAAASMASNFLIALEESAAELLADAGIEDARELLAPLVLRTAANWAENGGAALTGPIARGDEATVTRHLQAIAATTPELEPLYRALAERTRAIASEGARA